MLVSGYTFFDENSTSTQSESVANVKLLSQFTVQVEKLDQSASISLHVFGVSSLNLPEDYFEITGINNVTYKTVSVITSPGIYTFPISGIQKVRIVSDSPVGGFKVVGNIANSQAVASGAIVPTGNINITTTDTVNVAKYATAKVVDSNLVASNIVKGVKILGITGSYEGGVTPPSGTFNITSNGEYDISEYASVDVNVPQTIITSDRLDVGVNFIDYLGRTIEAWEIEDVAAKTSLPNLPHDGISTEWNWTLQEIKDYLEVYPDVALTVGALTSNPSTRLILGLKDGRLSPTISFALNGEATIIWGDGETTTVSGSSLETLINKKHTYSEAGAYVIDIYSDDEIAFIGNSTFGSTIVWSNSTSALENRVYQNSLYAVYLGPSLSAIGSDAFTNCGALSYIAMPSTVASIGENAFVRCSSLRCLILPRIATISSNACSGCSALSDVSIAPTITAFKSNAFINSAITDLIIPLNTTEIATGAFYGCSCLRYANVPASVVTLGSSAFYQCIGLSDVTFDANVASITQSSFNGCTSLTSFVSSSQYTNIDISAFNNCYSLTSFIVPSTVTSIERGAFVNCSGLGFIKFEGTTPPIVTNSTVWTNIPKDCKILVPAGTISEYENATNYPSSYTYTYEEY